MPARPIPTGLSAQGLFVTGTDTGIGKTHVSAGLVAALVACGAHAAGMKPVASGCTDDAGRLVNDDALALRQASRPMPAYEHVNPFALREAIAPHLAARQAAVTLTLDPIEAAYRALSVQADHIVVEGVGGWCVPLSDSLMQAHIPLRLGLPVVLVVGLRLGCLNHALLTARAIVADGCELVGWIANRVDATMPFAEENLDTLQQRLPAPLLGTVGHGPAASVADALAPIARHWMAREIAGR
ncbi:dethiobiotin synthase [Tahibacter amnicola]|uniref:ATP-dependent dethiobiotin synthetase BioD n=1 Tax=Tahibacter amnicola TaxID=2976241 RepID=A0ABY6BF51_9GAMM|nr:dethiobiotin synthase [Tahibacter amnicola]UXI68661.1 dethiobiotin synthase [Tahibacter amnicola]